MHGFGRCKIEHRMPEHRRHAHGKGHKHKHRHDRRKQPDKTRNAANGDEGNQKAKEERTPKMCARKPGQHFKKRTGTGRRHHIGAEKD